MLRRTLGARHLCTPDRTTTHFGFRTVDESDKERLVGNVFDSVASNYDVMNDLMSAGIHRAWKDSFVRMLGVGAQSSANLQVLDVAGGTGDIAFRIADELSTHPAATSRSVHEDEQARVVVCDINKQMLDEGRQRAAKLDPSRTAGWPRMDWIVADAQKLPFDDASFDVYTIAFGIRNVTRIPEALSEVRGSPRLARPAHSHATGTAPTPAPARWRQAHRVLRPGGRFLCLEFSRVNNALLREAYRQYSFHVIPKIGGLVANDAASYQYLVESIQRFPPQEDFAQMLRDAGLRHVSHSSLTGGIVAVHSGIKIGGGTR